MASKQQTVELSPMPSSKRSSSRSSSPLPNEFDVMDRDLRPSWIALKIKFKSAMRTLVARNIAKQIIEQTTRDLDIAKVGELNIAKPLTAKLRGPCECLFHLVTLYLVWTVTLNCIWTFDSYDAVSTIERHLLQSESAYSHEMSPYVEVDSLASLDVWMTNTIATLYREVEHRPLLRYKGLGKKNHDKKESICTPSVRNITYPLENGGSTSNYRVLRPLVDIIATRSNREQSGSTYMADGFLIRQVRGTLVSGVLIENNFPEGWKRLCNATHTYRNNIVTQNSVANGLYMDYPSNRGYDLFFPADMSLSAAKLQLKSALDCGFLDSYTRAIIATGTFTNFAELPVSKTQHVKDTENIKSAFGGYVDVSLSILFEIPQSGIVRGWHSFVVTDRLIESWGNEMEFSIMLTITILVLIRFMFYSTELCCSSSYNADEADKRVTNCMMSLKFLSIVIWFVGYAAYIQSFDSQIGGDNENVGQTYEGDELYFYCSMQGNLEENSIAGKKSNRETFLAFFGMFAILQCWECIDYLAVFPKIMIPVRTITAASREVGIFLIVYVVLVLGITIGLHVLFGDVRWFSTIGNTISTILLVTLDQMDVGDVFDGTQHHDRLKSRMCLIVVRLLLQVIFLNNFVAIVLVQYEIARSEKRIISEQSHKGFLIAGVRTTKCIEKCRQMCCNACCLSVDKQITDQQATSWITPSFRRWYHKIRTTHKTTKIPLRHDTEVIVKEVNKLVKMVQFLTEEQNKSKRQVFTLIDYTAKLDKKLHVINHEIIHLGHELGGFEGVNTSDDDSDEEEEENKED